MCGICGQFNFGDGSPVRTEDIHAMMQLMVHRGPDDQGRYVSGALGLGFRRLSIIDLACGHQPMSDTAESVWVVFNGEIYNFPQLRQELEAHGHVFRTRSDTEVIVHGYKQWGKEVLQHLNGMFGLAIWDAAEKQLLLARDPMGIKPLYYRLGANQVAFASEIRPLLDLEDQKPEIDPLAVSLFLRYRYTPSPLTVIRGIRKLAPGARLVAKADHPPVLEHWWNFRPEPFDPMPSDGEAAEQLLWLYRQAVKRQLISDVPLGLLLSGGMDSGLLLALMRQNAESWKTYTVGYGKSFAGDELSDAARTAQILGAPNVSLEIGRETFEATLPKILQCLEEPIASSSVIPMYHVCKRAREDVKVVFMGQGPDELFGGYTRHLGVRYGNYWRSLPLWLKRPVSSAMSRLPRREWIQRGLYSLAVANRLERYQKVLSIVPGEYLHQLFRREVLPAGASGQILDCWKDLIPLMGGTDELGGLQFLEVRSTLPDELLMYADKLSMAHSLEVRVPFLDLEIVRYVERLTAGFKVRRGTRKWLHRKVCRNFLPAEIMGRRKRGFAVNVVDDWFRSSLSRGMDGMLLDRGSLIHEFLEPEVIAQTLQDHRSGRHDNHKILFSLVVLEQMLRNFRALVAPAPGNQPAQEAGMAVASQPS